MELIDPWLTNDFKLVSTATATDVVHDGSRAWCCFFQAVDPADVAGFLRSPAWTSPGILQLLEATACGCGYGCYFLIIKDGKGKSSIDQWFPLWIRYSFVGDFAIVTFDYQRVPLLRRFVAMTFYSPQVVPTQLAGEFLQQQDLPTIQGSDDAGNHHWFRLVLTNSWIVDL